ncbi:MAG: hypothetical protein ACOYIF_12125 [Acetivibrionales bacterium]|jgi:hypothetical protein
MKNWLKIPGFPPPEEQDILKFYLFTSLPYANRMLLYFALVAVGFIFQIITLTAWPGVILLILATLLNLLKGYKAEYDTYHAESEWNKTSMEKIHQINQIRSNIEKWDKAALDITNKTGCLTFGVIAMGLFMMYYAIIYTGSTMAHVFFIDAIILIMPLWFNGLRRKANQNNLYIKSDLIIELEQYFEKVKNEGESFVPSMILARHKSGKKVPADLRFNILFDDMPEDFYGIQAQININVVSTSYPYCYCVITAKQGFDLERYIGKVRAPGNIVLEHSKDRRAEVIVIRQYTTRSSGYHTKINVCKNILELALQISRIILAENKQ